MDEFIKMPVGCAVVLAIGIIFIVGFADSQATTSSTYMSSGNFITQNTAKYGNDTIYMLQWNGSSVIIEGYIANTLGYSAKAVNGTQITIVVADGQTATLYANSVSIMKLTP